MGAEDLAAQMRAFKVGVEHLGEVVVGDVEVGHGRIHAGAVDEDVGTASGMDDRLKQRCHARAVDRVDRNKGAVTTRRSDRIDAGLATVGAAAGHNHKRPCLRQPLGQRAAQNARAAHDHSRTALEPEQIFQIGV